MRAPFESLLNAFVTIGDTAAQLHKKLLAPVAQHRLLSRWKKLPRDRRAELISDFIHRHPAPKTLAEQWEEESVAQPLFRCFRPDPAGPTFYDAAPGSYTLDEHGEWCVVPPTTRVLHLNCTLGSVEDLPNALITLASLTKCAFSMTDAQLARHGQKFGRVFLPEGDRRLEAFADKPEHAYALRGLPYSTALLFAADGTGEEAGLINVSGRGVGVIVWGRFYAVQLVDYRFKPSL